MAQDIEVYNNTAVENSGFDPRYITTLGRISIRDYGKDYGLSEEVSAIDLDKFEKDSSGQNDKTMDAVIGIANYVENESRASRLLLVELRLRYSGKGQNSKEADMKAKEAHSRDILNDLSVDKRSFFIFDKDVAPHKKNSVARKANADPSLNNWIVLSPEEFVNQFFFVSDLPYTPLSPIDDIRKNGTDAVAIADFVTALKLTGYWLEKAQQYYLQYKREECKALISVVDEILILLDEQKENLEEDSRLDLMIYQEGLSRYKEMLSY